MWIECQDEACWTWSVGAELRREQFVRGVPIKELGAGPGWRGHELSGSVRASNRV